MTAHNQFITTKAVLCRLHRLNCLIDPEVYFLSCVGSADAKTHGHVHDPISPKCSTSSLAPSGFFRYESNLEYILSFNKLVSSGLSLAQQRTLPLCISGKSLYIILFCKRHWRYRNAHHTIKSIVTFIIFLLYTTMFSFKFCLFI